MSTHGRATRIAILARRATHESEDAWSRRLAELTGLCEAAGGAVLAVCSQVRDAIDVALYVGSGKVAELAEQVKGFQVELVVADHELSPAQLRNLEDRIDCRVIDRTQLILDIFAERAKSSVGRLQVEIAQLQYLLPRLTGKGVEMSRLGAGIGTRGPGETKLEVDRRRIRYRISQLRQQLAKTKQTRSVQRDKRSKSVPVVALVGYTNAGKTTVLRRWTLDRGVGNADTGQNRLFDTLDPLARRVKSSSGTDIVVLDTVGFVQNLPHLLVDAFRATLEEVLSADLILHIVDASGDYATAMRTTYKVLTELGATDKPVVTFFNKMDIIASPPAPDQHAKASLFGSAETGAGFGGLYETVSRALGVDPVQIEMEGHINSPDFWANIAKAGKVLASEATDQGTVRVTVEMARNVATAQAYKSETESWPQREENP